jgi:hypothetical protein
MMSAKECRAKAVAMSVRADSAASYDEMIEWESLALAWRRLGQEAEWQDALQATVNMRAAIDK